MVDACIEALLAAVPQDAIEGVYLKGSARKRWDSPLDYVPELSDVDIHVLFAREAAVIAPWEAIDVALDIGQRTEASFRNRLSSPLHLPRIQLQSLNRLEQLPDYVPPPEETTRTVWGRSHHREQPGDATTRQLARSQLLAQEQYLTGLGAEAVDKCGRYLWSALRTMTWRVAPSGPRILTVIGVPFLDAWTTNRTATVRRLCSEGQGELAGCYAAFYIHAWDYFLSGYTDGDAARAAIRAGAEVLAAGVRIAQTTGK